MKKIVLLMIVISLSYIAFAQSDIHYDGGTPVEITVFPNPVTEYFSVTHNVALSQIIIFNLFGRKERVFSASNQSEFNISDLKNGLYLVQFIDKSNEVIATKRISKR